MMDFLKTSQPQKQNNLILSSSINIIEADMLNNVSIAFWEIEKKELTLDYLMSDSQRNIFDQLDEKHQNLLQTYWDYVAVPRWKGEIYTTKAESDLDHVFDMLSLWIELKNIVEKSSPPLNEKEIVSLIILHDLPEIMNGDITTDQKHKLNGTEKSALQEKEFKAFLTLLERLPEDQRKELQDLFKKYEHRDKEDFSEGQIVKFLDVLQALLFGMEHVFPYHMKRGKKIQPLSLQNLKNILSKMNFLPQHKIIEFITQKTQVCVQKTVEKNVLIRPLAHKPKRRLADFLMLFRIQLDHVLNQYLERSESIQVA